MISLKIFSTQHILTFFSVQSLQNEDNEQKWLETVTDWGEIISANLDLTENFKLVYTIHCIVYSIPS